MSTQESNPKKKKKIQEPKAKKSIPAIKAAKPKGRIKSPGEIKTKPAAKKIQPMLKPAKPRLSRKEVSKPRKPRVSRQKAPGVIQPQEPLVTAPPEIKKPAAPDQLVPEPVIEKKLPQAPPAQKPADIIAGEAALVELKELELELSISVKDLAIKLQIKPSELIRELMRMSVFATINQHLPQEIIDKVCRIYGYKTKPAPDKEEEALAAHRQKDAVECLKPRPPVVTFMGHVDHGKTSLLDIIRKTKISDTEYGGITQHIGAYEISLAKGKITFLDTPGHEAFTAMRSHGAHITDIVVLVVAADDGVMPQTVEAIDHARAAGVPIIVAINKIDRAQANPERVKKQLNDMGLSPEEWQGKTITVGVSAKTGEGVDRLLEMILLEAEMLELKSNYQKSASGVVIESRHDKNRGILATFLVEAGTLRIFDAFVVGLTYGKVKAMFDYKGGKREEASPGTPVGVLGLAGLPVVGEEFYVVSSDAQAKEIITLRQEKERKRQQAPTKRISLEELQEGIKQGKIKELKIIIKADVGGSLEAVRDSLEKLQTSEVKFQIIHSGLGSINSSDAILAKVTDALIIGFHVQPDKKASEIIEREGIEVRTYNIIYELISEIKAALEGMLEPKIKKIFQARAEVRRAFKLSRSGAVAGCYVTKGRFLRSALVELIRDDKVIFEGRISGLKRFKDDVREVGEGFECGISLAGFDDFQEGDIIVAYEIQKIARKLS